MKSTKCPACGFVGFLNAGNCKGCGKPIVEQSHEFTPATYYSDNTNYQSESGEGARKGLAVFSLVLGIISFFTFGLIGVGAVVGIIISIMAINRVKEDPWEYGGRSLAIAGLILNIVSLVSAVPIGIIAAIAIPNFYAARMAANEGSALSSLRTIANAEASHQSMFGKFASLEELAAKNLVDAQLGNGSKNGYRFTIAVIPMQYPSPEGYEVVAVPQTYQSSGQRSFFIDETAVIRAADNRGGPLTRLAAPLHGSDDDYPPMRRANGRANGY